MSLIEGDAYFPLFSTAEMPIDFSAAGLVPDSPGKFPQFNTRRASFALSASQQVPGALNLQNFGPLDEPLFSLFMNGPEKMDLNSAFVKGLQIPEELLLQSVPDSTRKPDMMGMDQRQFVQMGIMPEPMINGDFNTVPQLPTPAMKVPQQIEDPKGNNRKRKFIQNPVKCDPQGMPTADNGQPLTPEEERNMKRQRRLVKNREAAQLFRQRQKAYIQDLEKKVGDLSSTNNEFRARVELLNSENKLIKEQLLYLRNFITQAVSFSFPKSPSSDDGTTTSPTSLLGPMPPGLTLPPEILGAMGNMPGMALGLMGALGATSLPAFSSTSVSEAMSSVALSPQVPSSTSSVSASSMARMPPSPPEHNPLIPHIEPHSISLPSPSKLVNISTISPVALPTIPPLAALSVPVPNIPPIAPSVHTVPNIPPISVATVPTLIPPPTKPMNTNAVVPVHAPPSPPMVPDCVPEAPKVKVEKEK